MRTKCGILSARSLGVMLPVLCFMFEAHGENLLVNPGFEKVVRGMPQAWQVFVAPMEGAEGRLDEQVAAEGQRSVMLHNPEPYAKEPANNWSQNVIADLAGKRLKVNGAIRTKEATEAAIWLQCFCKAPFAVLKVATTSTDAPVYGTKEWTPVEMDVDVPDGTDFVVVRCVLKGSGTAWFDDINVTESLAQPVDKEGTEAEKNDSGGNKEQAKKENPIPQPGSAAPGGSPPEEANLDEVFEMLAEIPDTGKSPGGLDAEIKKQLLDSHSAMVDTNQTLRDMNVILMDQVLSLKDEVEALRAELQRIRTAAGLSPIDAGAAGDTAHKDAEQPAKSSAVTPPPLVPHGAKWEELVK